MILLPYVELPFWTKQNINGKAVAKFDFKSSLYELDESILDITHLMKSDSNYFFQVGFYCDGSVFTHEVLIKMAHDEFLRMLPKIDWYLVDDIIEHLDFYYKRMKKIPSWGDDEYYQLVAKNHTPRRLDGPHKEGQLRKGESRFVAFRKDGSNCYGPTMGYLRLAEKIKRE